MNRFLSFMVALIFLVSAGPVGAQMLCAERAQIVANLADKHKEAPVAMGLGANGALIEILTSADGGTFTVIMSRPNGTSCVMATGKDWMAVARVNTDPES